MNVNRTKEPDLLVEQLRLELDISDQSSIKTQDEFLSTYSSLHMILCQMQVKLASVFLQESEYLKQRERQLEQDAQLITQRMEQLKNIKLERKQLNKEFSKLQDRLEQAVVHVTNFQSDGEQILRLLFSESRQIDEDFSGLISQSTASLARCRTMIHERVDTFAQKTTHLQSELTDRENAIRTTQFSTVSLLELVDALNQLNIEHSQEITMTITDFEKRHRQFTNVSETTNSQWSIQEEMNIVRSLEKEKLQLEKELSNQTILLEHIQTIIGKALTN